MTTADDATTKNGYTLTTSNITNISQSPTPSINPDSFTTYDPFRNPANYGLSNNYYAGKVTAFTFSPAWDMSEVKYYNGGGYAPGQNFTLTLTYEDDTIFSASYNTASMYNSPFDILASGFDPSKKVKAFNHTDNAGTQGAVVGFYKADQSGLKYPFASVLKELTFADPCPDLRYFEQDDVVQTSPATVKVVDTDVANRKMTVDGGDWLLTNSSEPWSYYSNEPANASNYAIEQAFDGDETTYWFPYVGGTYKWDMGAGNGISYSSINIKFGKNNAGGTVRVNGVDVTSLVSGASVVLDTAALTGAGVSSPLQSIEITHVSAGNGSYLYYVELDNAKLVDKIKSDIVWSSNATPSAPLPDSQDPNKGFNGNQSTGRGYFYAPIGGDTVITFPDVAFTKLEFHTWKKDDGSVFEVTGDNGTVNIQTTIDADPNNRTFAAGGYRFDATSLVTSPLKQIKVTKTASPTSAGFTAVYVDEVMLVDSDQAGAASGSNKVTYATTGGEGTVVKINGNDAYITNSGDRDSRWIATNEDSTSFYIAPQTPVSDSTTTAYAILEQTNGEINVKGIQKNDPGFTDITDKDGTIKFPAKFTGTDNPPDTDLPNGVAITATVYAENSEGNDEQDSNTLLPQTPNPTGSVGPITASTSTTITSANTGNIAGLTAGDNLIMVDSSGATATYQLQTVPIVKVESDVNGYKLTFNGDVANNEDLKFFRASDLVQATAVQWAVTGANKNEVNVTGDPFEGTGRLSLNKANVRITFTYPTPVEFNTLGITKFSGGGHNVGSAYTMGFIDENGNLTTGNGSTASSWGVTSTPVAPPAKGQRILHRWRWILVWRMV